MNSETATGLSTRQKSDELLDQPGLDPVERARALIGLRRINALSRSAAVLWPSIARAAAATPGPLRVLDLACGGGDVTVALARRAVRAGLDVRFEGCDVSPTTVSHAEGLARSSGAAVSFFEWDALRDPIPEGFDVICCSLFLHHLDSDEAVSLLAEMAAAARIVLVNDLARGRFGYALAWVGCRLLSRSPVVHNDGPVSVAGAFTPAEALELAEWAGLSGANVSRRWPARFLLSWARE